jgi:hypothetical protein
MECGSEAAALGFERTAVAGATALQGAYGTSTFNAVAHVRLLMGSQKAWKRLPSLAKEGVGGGWSSRGAGTYRPCPSSR